MITGIPNSDVMINDVSFSDTKEKIFTILGEINATLYNDEYELQTVEIGEEKPTHAVKLIFKDIETKKKVMKNAMKFKGNEHFGTVYIRNNETKLTREENFRLRQKARALRAVPENENVVIKIEKGKLMNNGAIVDKFDITNQIFR